METSNLTSTAVRRRELLVGTAMLVFSATTVRAATIAGHVSSISSPTSSRSAMRVSRSTTMEAIRHSWTHDRSGLWPSPNRSWKIRPSWPVRLLACPTRKRSPSVDKRSTKERSPIVFGRRPRARRGRVATSLAFRAEYHARRAPRLRPGEWARKGRREVGQDFCAVAPADSLLVTSSSGSDRPPLVSPEM